MGVGLVRDFGIFAWIEHPPILLFSARFLDASPAKAGVRSWIQRQQCARPGSRHSAPLTRGARPGSVIGFVGRSEKRRAAVLHSTISPPPRPRLLLGGASPDMHRPSSRGGELVRRAF